MNKLQLQFIANVKERIRQAQYEALKTVNIKLIELYWDIGRSIAEKQQESWGKAVVPTLSKELQKEFPGTGGFSEGNLWLMAQFYTEYQHVENLVPLVREISWSKHVAILKKCKNNLEREFYILATKKFGWTKNILAHQINNKAYEKHLLSQNNFNQTLPTTKKVEAALSIKDEYTFDFIGLPDEHSERELENALVQNIRSFLLEMGNQFTFVGNQFKIEVNDKEYFIDLLLYHRQLQCLVAIELKIGEFIPEYKGKMEFYLSVLNDKIKLPHENDSIGIIICREKDRTIVEYSLKTSNSAPIGVASYSSTNFLPKEYRKLLPDEKGIRKRLDELKP